MQEAEMNRETVYFFTDNQAVALHPQGLDSSALAPAAPKTSKLVRVLTLALMVITIVTSLIALFFVVLQKPRPEPEAYAYSQKFLGDNVTGQLPVETDNSCHFERVAELQGTLQMFKDHVENSSTWTMEIQMLMCRVDNVSSQIQTLDSHLQNTSADIQMVLNDQLKNASREIQTLKQEMKDTAALKSKTQMLESSLQKASAEVQRLKGNLENTETLTAKVQEQQRSLETLRAEFDTQKQLQKSQNEYLQLILEGWQVYNRNLYYFSHVKKSWHEAEQSCVSQGAHLASVTSAEEQEYVTKFTGTLYHWIGLTDSGNEGSWRWTDGTPFNFARSRAFWYDNQPDNWQHSDGHDEDCVHMLKKWNDNSCKALFHWVCKKPISQVVA